MPGVDRHTDLTQEAASTALDALAAAGIEVVDAAGPAHAERARHLLDRIGAPLDPATGLTTASALQALIDAGGQVSIGQDGDGRDLAVTVAVRHRSDGDDVLHSLTTAVVAEARGRGIGRAMKWHQRAWALQRGIEEVRWSIDPLVRRVAVLHLAALGARVDATLPVPQGSTDQVAVRWELGAPRVRAAASGRVATPDVSALRAAGAEVALAVDGDQRPRVAHTTAPRRLLQVPPDIEVLRSEAPEIAAAWVEALRATLRPALQRGARVTGVTRDGWYVLSAPAGVEELAGR